MENQRYSVDEIREQFVGSSASYARLGGTVRSPQPPHGDRVQVQVDRGLKYLTGQLYS